MLGIGSAAELNPAAVVYKLPDQIPWSPVDARGAQNAVVVGDPTKPGFYMVYNKWTKGNHFSRPHFHPNDRFIVVLQGTWWVGSGPKFDPDNGTVPMPAGSFVTHFGKQVHYDGMASAKSSAKALPRRPAPSRSNSEALLDLGGGWSSIGCRRKSRRRKQCQRSSRRRRCGACRSWPCYCSLQAGS